MRYSFSLRRCVPLAVLVLAPVVACSAADTGVPAQRLALAFDRATIGNPVEPVDFEPIEWRFDGEQAAEFRAIDAIDGLRVADGVLSGRATGTALITVAMPEQRPDDLLHAIEIRLKASAGSRLGVVFGFAPEVDDEALIGSLRGVSGDALGTPERTFLLTPLITGEETQTYTLTMAASTMVSSVALAGVQHLILIPTDEAGADFELESVRIISRRQHLASIPSGVSWQGLGEIYRETIVARAPETVTFDVGLPSQPRLDLWVGAVEEQPVTFVVSARTGAETVPLARRTVTTADRWEALPVDLAALAGQSAEITLALESPVEGTIGYWGGVVVRQVGARPQRVVTAPAVAQLAPDRVPRGVIVVMVDTLRRDHLEAWGHSRETAPVLTSLMARGARFSDNISQGTWTKVSVPSMLTSLYAGTHGIINLPDRLPASVTTLAEVYQAAGYATFATSSVPFTGKLTNLHQGIEELHEVASVGDLPHSGAKTARTFVDRLLPWLDGHHDVPFYAFLHVFDPHSPFEPYEPYRTLFSTEEENRTHLEQLDTVREHITNDHMRGDGLPTESELAASGVDRESFLRSEKAWYDASIRGFDAELGRLLERLETHGIRDDTLIVVLSDHGEEFLEHGRHFHGDHAYGEMINVPLAMVWPAGLPAGQVVERTVQSIDMFPTVLQLSGLALPPGIQGQSLVPLLAAPEAPTRFGYRPGPAFSERARIPSDDDADMPTWDQWVIVADGWKLVQNANQPDSVPEFELFDHVADPLNLTNVADAHAQHVERLAEELRTWREMTAAARLTGDETEGLDAAELDRLRSLGYIQ